MDKGYTKRKNMAEKKGRPVTQQCLLAKESNYHHDQSKDVQCCAEAYTYRYSVS